MNKSVKAANCAAEAIRPDIQDLWTILRAQDVFANALAETAVSMELKNAMTEIILQETVVRPIVKEKRPEFAAMERKKLPSNATTVTRQTEMAALPLARQNSNARTTPLAATDSSVMVPKPAICKPMFVSREPRSPAAMILFAVNRTTANVFALTMDFIAWPSASALPIAQPAPAAAQMIRSVTIISLAMERKLAIPRRKLASPERR